MNNYEANHQRGQTAFKDLMTNAGNIVRAHTITRNNWEPGQIWNNATGNNLMMV